MSIDTYRQWKQGQIERTACFRDVTLSSDVFKIVDPNPRHFVHVRQRTFERVGYIFPCWIWSQTDPTAHCFNYQHQQQANEFLPELLAVSDRERERVCVWMRKREREIKYLWDIVPWWPFAALPNTDTIVCSFPVIAWRPVHISWIAGLWATPACAPDTATNILSVNYTHEKINLCDIKRWSAYNCIVYIYLPSNYLSI